MAVGQGRALRIGIRGGLFGKRFACQDASVESQSLCTHEAQVRRDDVSGSEQNQVPGDEVLRQPRLAG